MGNVDELTTCQDRAWLLMKILHALWKVLLPLVVVAVEATREVCGLDRKPAKQLGNFFVDVG